MAANGVNTFLSCLQTVLCLAICAEVCRPRPAQVVVVEVGADDGGEGCGGGERAAVGAEDCGRDGR